MSRSRWLALIVVLCAIAATLAAASGSVTLVALQQQRAGLDSWRLAHPWAAAWVFVLGYILTAALSLPINVVLALAGGAVFGPWLGSVLVDVSAAIGSTLAMLSSRWLLRDVVRVRFGRRLDEVEAGLARDGWVYLLSLRLMPVVPYTVVNLLFGLTRFPPWRFLLISLVGMAPATFLYVQAGTALDRLGGVGDVLSVRLVVSLALVATLPLVTGRLLRLWRRRSNKY